MTIVEENFLQGLQNSNAEDWNYVNNLLSALESHEYSSITGDHEGEEDSIELRQTPSGEVTENRLREFLQKFIIPNFDWVSWEEGRRILKNKSFDYSGQETLLLCKLLTLIIRLDRFSDGFFSSCLEKGSLSEIIRSLRANREAGKKHPDHSLQLG